MASTGHRALVAPAGVHPARARGRPHRRIGDWAPRTATAEVGDWVSRGAGRHRLRAVGERLRAAARRPAAPGTGDGGAHRLGAPGGPAVAGNNRNRGGGQPCRDRAKPHPAPRARARLALDYSGSGYPSLGQPNAHSRCRSSRSTAPSSPACKPGHSGTVAAAAARQKRSSWPQSQRAWSRPSRRPHSPRWASPTGRVRLRRPDGGRGGRTTGRHRPFRAPSVYGFDIAVARRRSDSYLKLWMLALSSTRPTSWGTRECADQRSPPRRKSFSLSTWMREFPCRTRMHPLGTEAVGQTVGAPGLTGVGGSRLR